MSEKAAVFCNDLVHLSPVIKENNEHAYTKMQRKKCKNILKFFILTQDVTGSMVTYFLLSLVPM